MRWGTGDAYMLDTAYTVVQGKKIMTDCDLSRTLVPTL